MGRQGSSKGLIIVKRFGCDEDWNILWDDSSAHQQTSKGGMELEECQREIRSHAWTFGRMVYYRLSSGVRALALALVPSTITDYLALALAQAKSKLSEYL